MPTAQNKYLVKPGMKKSHSLQRDIGDLIKRTRPASNLPQYTGISNKGLLLHLWKQFSVGMDWDNYGKGRNCWQVDRIKPKHQFDLGEPGELEKCFHYSNLRPLWHPLNAAWERPSPVKEKAA